MDRRELFKIVGAGLLAGRQMSAQDDHEQSSHEAAYRPRFFSEDEYRTVAALVEILAPADEMSPGAREAGVPWYIDTVLYYAGAEERDTWRNGIEDVGKAARRKFDRPFLECDSAQQGQIMAEMAENEGYLQTDLQYFFEPLKRLTIEAFSLSDIGMHQYFGYRGDTMLTDFPGCTHPEHQR